MEFEASYPSCFVSNSNWVDVDQEWSKEENKRFESALAIYDKDTPDRWFKVAATLPTKSVYDVIKHYKELVQDVCEIEAGRVPVPGYDRYQDQPSSFSLEVVDDYYDDNKHKNGVCKKRHASVGNSDQERKKGVPWTEEEHKRFLLGLLKHGKGDWRSISRNFVITKTPTQVASHAQKYYIRQAMLNGGKDNKRRPSIHDITFANLMEKATKSDQDKPLPCNESHMLPNAQPEGINYHYNDATNFNPNCDDMFMLSSLHIFPQNVKFV